METNSTALPQQLTRDESGSLLGQTMGLVAVTTGLFALGAYLGRDMSYGWGWLFFIAAFGVLLGINVAVQRSEGLAVTLLFGFGVLMGLATAPTLSYYASTNPQVLWQAGGATALFIAGFGAFGYATTARPVGDRPRLLLGADRTDRVRDRVDLRPDPERLADLRDPWAHDLRGLDGFRLPAAAPDARHPSRSDSGRVDLPRHPERFSPAVVHLWERELTHRYPAKRRANV